MSKLAIICDNHAGVRNDGLIFQENANRFFGEIFFPSLDKYGVNHILHLGDMWDRRKYINYMTLNRVNDYLFNPLKEKNIQMDLLVGNHDAPLRNMIDINSNELILYGHPNVNLIKNPISKKVHDIEFCFIPWICAENNAECLDHMKTSSAPICLGHFEIAGFVMNQGQICTSGLDRNLFEKFHMTFSGHFHKRSSDGDIFYLGAPLQYTWIDYNDTKGFHIFDTETRELTFIKNPYNLFHKIIYDEKNTDIDFDLYKDVYVKIIISEKKKNLGKYDRFLNELYKVTSNIGIVENFIEKVDVNIEEVVNQSDDTITLLEKYVDKVGYDDIDPIKLKMMFKSIYLDAISLEV